MASSESSLLVLEDVVVSLESSLWDSSPKELIDSMNLPISSISTSRDVSSIQPKTRRLDEAYHRLQLLHLSQNLEDKRLLQKKTQKVREKTRKVCRINKNWPFDVVLISFSCALMQNAELQQNSKTWKLGGFSVQATESLRLGGAATHASLICSLGLDVSSLPLDSLAVGAASSASKPCLSYQLYLKWPITWPILWLLNGLPSSLVTDSQFWPLLTPILPKGSLFGAGAICSLPSAHRSWPERQARGTYSKVPDILSHTLNPFKFQ